MLPLWSLFLPPNDSLHIPLYCSFSYSFPSANRGQGGRRKKRKRKKSTAAWQMLVQMSDADVINGYSLWSYKYKIMSTTCNDKTAHEIFQYMLTVRAISGLNYQSIFYWVEIIFLTEEPLFMWLGFFQISVTVFTLVILINVLWFPYFLKTSHFIRKIKAFTALKSPGSRLSRMKLSQLQHLQ